MAKDTPAATDTGPAAQVVVSDTLRDPHQLVRQTKEHRGSGVASSRSGPSTDNTLDMDVSRQSLGRALRIMDALIKAWESHGGTVVVKRDLHIVTKWSTYFGVGEDQVAVRLEEKQQRVPGPSNRPWEYSWKCTGELALRMEHLYGDDLRATWADGKRQRLENVLDSVVTTLLERVSRKKQERLDSEIDARQRRRAAERREVAKRREAEEKQRREELRTEVDCWHYAERIRTYLASIEGGVAEGTLQAQDEQSFAEWLRWAHWYADHVDPLVRAEPVPEETRPPVNAPLTDVELTSRARSILGCLGVRDTDALCSLSREDIRAAGGDFAYALWNEVCTVLEGLGYDLAGRDYRL